MPSVTTMIRRMHDVRDEIEVGIIGDAGAALTRIFNRAERRLTAIESEFSSLLTMPDGNISQIPENIAQAQKIVDKFYADVQETIVKPGKAWAKDAVPAAFEAGRTLAETNMDVDFLSPELVKATFANITPSEKAVIQVGYENVYKIMNVVGDDATEWFRREMMDAVIDGIPVQGGPDSLAGRIIQSGRLKPIKIKTQSGRLITRSISQRANTIARVEMARVANKTHEMLASRALGAEAVYINSNPMDSRTTDVCARASTQVAMTLAEWDRSPFGRPPRLNPFHMCRSVLIGGQRDWFGDRSGAVEAELAAAEKPAVVEIAASKTLVPPTFTRVADADKWAKENIKHVKFVGMKGTNMEVVNDSLASVAQIQSTLKGGATLQRDGVNLVVEFGKFPRGYKNAAGLYFPGKHSIMMRKNYSKDGWASIQERYTESRSKFAKTRKLVIDGKEESIQVPFIVGGSIKDIVTHEVGHAVDNINKLRPSGTIRGIVQAGVAKATGKAEFDLLSRFYSVSQYGSSDIKGRCVENFAESWTAIVTKSPNAKWIDPRIKSMITDLIEVDP